MNIDQCPFNQKSGYLNRTSSESPSSMLKSSWLIA